MNVHTPLLVGTLCAALALSSAAGAAPETAPPPQAGTAAAAAPTDTPTNTPPAAAPHNHMTEKLGVPASQHAPGDAAAPHGKDEKTVKRHNHQRDMK